MKALPSNSASATTDQTKTSEARRIAAEYQRRYRAVNGERIARQKRTRRANEPRKVWALAVVRNAKQRAAEAGQPFDLDVDYVQSIAPTHCPMLGLELNYAGGMGAGPKPNSPTVDRIKPELGYVRSNVQVISHRANKIKNDATPLELLKIATHYGGLLGRTVTWRKS